MNLAKLVMQQGPAVLQKYIETQKAAGVDTAFLEEFGPGILDGLADGLLAQEHERESGRKASFMAHLAADLLRGWPGEPSAQAADQAVDLAHHIMNRCELIASKKPPAPSP